MADSIFKYQLDRTLKQSIFFVWVDLPYSQNTKKYFNNKIIMRLKVCYYQIYMLKWKLEKNICLVTVHQFFIKTLNYQHKKNKLGWYFETCNELRRRKLEEKSSGRKEKNF